MSPIQKNVAGQRVIVFAFDATTGAALAGDAANITGYVSKDYGAVTALADTSAAEMDSSNAAGYYWISLAQAETNATHLVFTAKSSTLNARVIAVPTTMLTAPPNNSLLAIDASGRVDLSKILGTALDDSAAGALAATIAGNISRFFGVENDGEGGIALWDLLDIAARAARIPNIAAGQAGGLFIAGTNAATTLASQTITGTQSINGVSNVAQTGDSYARIGANGASLTSVPGLVAAMLLEDATIDGQSLGWILSRIGAALLSTTSGNTGEIAGQTEVIRNLADDGDAFTVATDVQRNRTAVTDGAAPVIVIP